MPGDDGAVSIWPAPLASTPVHATVTVPGSKSQTNRTLVLAAVAAAHSDATSTVSGALRSRDTDLMIGALGVLGLKVSGAQSDLTINGQLAPRPEAQVDCGLAGTVLRFVPPLAALGAGTVSFDGDQQARSRPVTPLLDALRALGVGVDGAGLPFVVRGTGSVAGGTVEIDASASSQLVSGLLLSAPAFDAGLEIVTTGPSAPSAPHIAMTVAMLRDAGVDVDDTQPDRWRVAPSAVAAQRWTVEPDLSNAVPFIAAAVVTSGTVRINGWSPVSIQPAGDILDILHMLDCAVLQGDTYLEVQGPTAYGGIDTDLHEVGELTPSVAALAALADPGSVSRLSGVAHLRGHETDRLAALSAEITRLGGRCEQTDDGLVITAAPLHGGTWRSYADHRMAMAGAIVGLRVPDVAVDDIETTAKTLPDFPQLWADMLAGQDPGS